MSGVEGGQMWIDEAQWGKSTRGGELPESETSPAEFMAAVGIDRATFGEALREYRSLDGNWVHDSPWEDDELNTLTTDFINWYRWERL